jgi:hypothetical protein
MEVKDPGSKAIVFSQFVNMLDVRVRQNLIRMFLIY